MPKFIIEVEELYISKFSVSAKDFNEVQTLISKNHDIADFAEYIGQELADVEVGYNHKYNIRDLDTNEVFTYVKEEA